MPTLTTIWATLSSDKGALDEAETAVTRGDSPESAVHRSLLQSRRCAGEKGRSGWCRRSTSHGDPDRSEACPSVQRAGRVSVRSSAGLRRSHCGVPSRYRTGTQGRPSPLTTSAMRCWQKGELDEAITAYRQAIALNPKDGEYHCWLGEALRRTGQTKEAIEALQTAITLNPNLAAAHSSLGSALDDNGDLDGAVTHYQQAIHLDPNDAKTHYASLHLCWCARSRGTRRLRRRGKRSAASQTWPRHTATSVVCCKRTGQLREALESLQRGHELGSKDPNWKYPSAQWIQECQELLKESEVRQGPAGSDAADWRASTQSGGERRGETKVRYRLARTRSLSREAAALCQPRASAAPPWGTVPNTGLALKGQHSREPGISAPFQGFPMHAHCVPRAALRLPWADLGSPLRGWAVMRLMLWAGLPTRSRVRPQVSSAGPIDNSDICMSQGRPDGRCRGRSETGPRETGRAKRRPGGRSSG